MLNSQNPKVQQGQQVPLYQYPQVQQGQQVPLYQYQPNPPISDSNGINQLADSIGFNKVDRSIFSHFINRKCEICLSNTLLGNSHMADVKGMVQCIGNHFLLIKIIHKKKDRFITINLDHIMSIATIDD